MLERFMEKREECALEIASLEAALEREKIRLDLIDEMIAEAQEVAEDESEEAADNGEAEGYGETL